MRTGRGMYGAAAVVWRGAALLLCVAAVSLAGARPASALVKGSRHDFSASQAVGTDGACAGCHLPHTARDTRLWPRSLAEERAYFVEIDAPNYVLPPTLHCYDCHDDNATTTTPAVDDDPPKGTPPSGSWTSGLEPQNVAFGYTYALTAVLPPTTIPDDDGVNGTKTGYYELVDGKIPAPKGTGTLPAAGDPTGGHYWKSEPNGPPAQGDKIACSLCHDPHQARTGSNEAFFLRTATFPDGSTVPLGLDGLKASAANDVTNPNRSRHGTGTGREMCAACHGYANAGSQVSFGGGTVPKPPLSLTQHRSGNGTPCTICHPHNRVYTSCNECHGFPPLLTETQAGGTFLKGDPLRKDAESYPGGAGAHQRHKDALGDTVFQCEICHGPNAGSAEWHNDGDGVVAQNRVNIMGLSAYWDPDGSRATDYAGTSNSPPLTPSSPDPYEFSKTGGGDQRCWGLACHGNPPNTAGAQFGTALNWTDDMIDGDRIMRGVAPLPYENPNPGEIQICKWCHNAVTPAVIDFGSGPIAAPGVMGDGANWGADVNGHGLPILSKYDRDMVGDTLGKQGAGKDCTACHDARYEDNGGLVPANKPYWTHFDGANDTAEKRLNGRGGTLVNGLPAADADEVCVNCHQNGATGTEQFLAADVSTHGNDFANNAEGAQGSMSRSCRQCHDVHGANWNGLSAAAPSNGRNLYMVGRWVDADQNGKVNTASPASEAARVDSDATNDTANITASDRAVVLTRVGTPTTGSADDSLDDGFNDGEHESVCVVCHESAKFDQGPNHGPAVAPYYNTVESTATQGTGHNPVGYNCLLCHDHDYDNVAATADGFAPSGCTGCHGTNSIEMPLGQSGVDWFRGQFWPDGNVNGPQVPYADDEVGAHRNHVDSIAWQLFGQGAIDLVKDNVGPTPAVQAMLSVDKQRTVCAFCHPPPPGSAQVGGPQHYNNDTAAPSGVDRVDVFGGTGADLDPGPATIADWLRKYIPNAGSDLALHTNDTTAAPPNGYNYATQSCGGGAAANQNLVCHNQAPTPKSTDVAPLSPGNWSTTDPSPSGSIVVPNWTTSNANCSNTTCHAAATYTIQHAVHVNGSANNAKGYACTECHANNFSPLDLGHGNGEVDMVFNVTAGITPAPLEASIGLGDGYYNKDGVAGPTAGDTAFAYKNGSYANACSLVYCHGGDNTAAKPPDWGGSFTAPVWNDTNSAYCGSCHDGNATGPLPAGDASVIATGKHAAHLTATYGPRFALAAGIGPGSTAASCLGTATVGCHSNFTLATPTHVNGTTEFHNNNTTTVAVSALGLTAPVGAPTAASTDRCNSCHSTTSMTVNIKYPAPATVTGSGTVLAKANWATAAYTLPCLTCHNGSDAATVYADGSGAVTAPDVRGTDLLNAFPTPDGSGAEVRGHSRALAEPVYQVSGNPPADKTCVDCHSAAVVHINNSSDTDYPGNRMLGAVNGGTINGQSPTTATGACNACHATTAGTPALRNNINAHGNNGATFREPAAFTTECQQCHEPHGMTFNGADYNIYMVPSTITIVPGTTATGVRFQAKTGSYSLNDTLGTPALCVVCHVSGANPGAPMLNVTGDGRHFINNNPLNPLPLYDADERGNDCSSCHTHNKDKALPTATTVDGFMPLECNSCHTYPGLAVEPATHINSSAHDIHTGSAGVAAPVNYAIRCRTCHYGNDHNEALMEEGGTWPATAPGAAVDIRFDPARNTGAPTYNGVNAAIQTVPGVGGTGVCAALYCHGNGTNGTNGGNLPFPTGFQGSSQTPQWSLTAPARTCVTCHESSTSASPIGTQSHAKHVGPVANGQYAIGCQVCHYGTTANGTIVPAGGMPIHVNGSVEVTFDAAGDTRVDGTSTYNNGANTGIGAPYFSCSATYCHSQGTDTNQSGGFPDDAAQTLVWGAAATCGSCHGDGLANAKPLYADGSLKANKHAIHTGAGDPLTTPDTNGYECRHCHYPTTHNNGTSLFTTLYHVNGSYTVDDDNSSAVGPELGFDSFSYTAGSPGSCTAIVCHGGTSAAWDTASIACDTCHASVDGLKTGVADVNEFNGRNWVQSKISDVPGGEYATRGHGAKGVLCSGCHNSNIGHDLTTPLAGTDPYRLDLAGGFTCQNTAAGCHVSASAAAVANHSEAAMTAASLPPQRSAWPWTPQCMNCHDPHGDATNLAMIQRELYDKEVFNLTGAAPTAPTEQPNLVFTDNTSGLTPAMVSFADSSVFSSICQECHEAAGLTPASRNMVSFKDGGTNTTVDPHPGHPNGNPGKCTDCHTHASGFAPSSCTGCHGDPPHTGTNNGSGADAPNVMTYWTTSGHGKVSPAVTCEGCHNIGVPTPRTHLTGTLERTASAVNDNPFHLVTGFIAPSPSSEWVAQVTFDDYCWGACHDGNGGTALTTDMRHLLDNDPAFHAMRMGDNNSYPTIHNTPPPDMFYDRNITWLDTYDGAPYFALCITCHNPHGTGATTHRTDGNNKMAVYRWAKPATLCNKCHI